MEKGIIWSHGIYWNCTWKLVTREPENPSVCLRNLPMWSTDSTQSYQDITGIFHRNRQFCAKFPMESQPTKRVLPETKLQVSGFSISKLPTMLWWSKQSITGLMTRQTNGGERMQPLHRWPSDFWKGPRLFSGGRAIFSNDAGETRHLREKNNIHPLLTWSVH
jgi:hypothetical protein